MSHTEEVIGKVIESVRTIISTDSNVVPILNADGLTKEAVSEALHNSIGLGDNIIHHDPVSISNDISSGLDAALKSSLLQAFGELNNGDPINIAELNALLGSIPKSDGPQVVLGYKLRYLVNLLPFSKTIIAASEIKKKIIKDITEPLSNSISAIKPLTGDYLFAEPFNGTFDYHETRMVVSKTNNRVVVTQSFNPVSTENTVPAFGKDELGAIVSAISKFEIGSVVDIDEIISDLDVKLDVELDYRSKANFRRLYLERVHVLTLVLIVLHKMVHDMAEATMSTLFALSQLEVTE